MAMLQGHMDRHHDLLSLALRWNPAMGQPTERAMDALVRETTEQETRKLAQMGGQTAITASH